MARHHVQFEEYLLRSGAAEYLNGLLSALYREYSCGHHIRFLPLELSRRAGPSLHAEDALMQALLERGPGRGDGGCPLEDVARLRREHATLLQRLEAEQRRHRALLLREAEREGRPADAAAAAAASAPAQREATDLTV